MSKLRTALASWARASSGRRCTTLTSSSGGPPLALSLGRRPSLALRRRRPLLLPSRLMSSPSGTPGASSGGGSGGARQASAGESLADKNARLATYAATIAVAVVGLSYAAVPLYQMFCQATGFGGEVRRADADALAKLTPRADSKVFKVTFNTDTSDNMPWKFRPIQRAVKLVPGETALAFFRAKNTSEKDITGVATYNVTPIRAGVYFHKIQCFCFEEQRLEAGEEVDMPVFFYVDPDILDDPLMRSVSTLTLSYTFFPSNSGDSEEEEEEEGSSSPTGPAAAPAASKGVLAAS